MGNRAPRFATGRTTGRPAAMDTIGLDLHQRESQLCICDADGTITERRIVTSRERFTAVLGNRPRTKILLEASTESEGVARHLESLGHEGLVADVQPLFTVLAPRNEQIAAADRRIATLAATDPLVARLATAPAIGPVTASAVVATIDDIARFRSAHQCEAYLGLVPGERSSGEKRHVGPITKAGNSRVHCLLCEAPSRLLRTKSPAAAALRTCAH